VYPVSVLRLTFLLLAACGSAPRTTGAPPVAAAPDAGAADDCALDLASIESKLIHDAPGVKTVAAPRVENRHLSESVRLADGVTVTFSIGGCAHFAYQFDYELPSGAPGGSVAERLEAIAKLLERTPARDDMAADLARKVRAKLAAGVGAEPSDGPWPLDCGDAVCAVELKPSGVRVGYDFPL
jgi:hypothetical protein